ncbi:MAG: apolipoprotein N-acyltransferase [bacterium]|nr:apolipoprotein N-acyltransferase [bacterium]
MAKSKHLSYIGLSILSAVMFSFAWQPFKLLPLAFFGFVPLFMLERKIRSEQIHSTAWLFLYAWLAFMAWNIGSVWWIWNASEGGAIAAFFINSLPMVLPILLFHKRNRITVKDNYWFFIACWMSIEFLQFHWDFAFPWLLLGNVFSYLPETVQWYEFTGVLGGSLWILMVNVQADQLWRAWPSLAAEHRRKMVLNKVFVYLLAPLFLSFYLLQQLSEPNRNKVEMLLVQPNLDPYSDKFGGVSPTDQLMGMLQQAEEKMDAKVQFVLLPETALQGNLLENELGNEGLIQVLKGFLSKHPSITILSGMDSYYQYAADEKRSITARKFRNADQYYDAYNAAIQVNSYDSLQVYHKNKLVPGVEKMPYPALFGFIEKFAIDLGGTSGTLGSDGESKVFKNYQKISLAPIICYESVFADFTASYVRKGADVLCILTNDGWWGNTPGYLQHFDYGRLRAIENRRAIARCANTGISGFIDQDGSVMMATNWWEKAVVRAAVPVYTQQTFYTQYGDWIAYIFVFMAIADSLTLFVKPRQ